MFKMSDFNISIGNSLYEDIAFHIDYHKTPLDEIEDELNKPCNMNYILLCSNYYKDISKVFDVKDLSNRQVCNIIYRFYTHSTIQRMMGDHTFIEGWFIPTKEEGVFEIMFYGS